MTREEFYERNSYQVNNVFFSQQKMMGLEISSFRLYILIVGLLFVIPINNRWIFYPIFIPTIIIIYLTFKAIDIKCPNYLSIITRNIIYKKNYY